MTWFDGTDLINSGIGPHVSAVMSSPMPADDNERANTFVKCDGPACDMTWDVIGDVDTDAKDEYLRTQGWSAVPATYAIPAVMRHLCLEHA